MPQIQPNYQKFQELILYISQKCANDASYGATKLNKVLHFSDFLHYAYYGTAITGVEYQKLPHGPAPRQLLPIRERMMASGDLGIQPMPISSRSLLRPVNLRTPNLESFSATEIALVDAVIEMLSGRTAKATSDLSHSLSGWKLASSRETIPYASVFLTDRQKATASDIARGLEIALEYGLLEATT